ncbi:metallophosphoesterase [Myxococcota bacterium]|nr:metallophosphoesterase [Myxococcota bacterium]MBU1413342.1 metallophosphoesterase [Myxococcota bacterium]MBU1511490.1 metallophosphoesterase [Myxococcota bacterium]
MNISFLFAFLILGAPLPAPLPGDLPLSAQNDAPPAAQEQPVAVRIRQLRSPTIGFPAILNSGGRFAIWSTRKPASARLLPADGCGAPQILVLSMPTSVADGRMFRTEAGVPGLAPRAAWHLEVVWDDGTRTEEPLAVRLLGWPVDGPFRFAVMTDHQLLDPSWEIGDTALAPGKRPSYGEKKANLVMTEQIFSELRLLDPDMVVHLGDLLFGLKFPEEYESMFRRIAKSRLVSYYIPGNHDAYATYSVRLPDLGALALGFVQCRSKMPKNLDFKASWFEIWTFLSCMYTDLKDELFSHLVSDGLEHWKATLGPVNHAQVRGRFHFIFLNTYGGTNKRRHSFSIYAKMFDRHIGAPMVDNYGGSLGEAELSFVRDQLAQATAAGRTPVVFGHHDPRGNTDETPYHQNEPFPTDPVGIKHFEEWNYDGAWDSDPDDKRGRETAQDNSGVELVKLLAASGGYYISGHLHKDGQWSYAAGEAVTRSIRAQKPLTFVKVTTAAGSTKDGSRWGYRMFTAQPDGTLDLSPLVPGRKSIPGGNFWVETRLEDVRGEVRVYNALPVPLTLHVPLCLPVDAAGYRLKSGAGLGQPLEAAPFAGEGFTRFVYRLQAPTGATVFSAPGVLDLVLSPAEGNRPPEVRLSADGRPVTSGADVPLPRRLDASGTTDPEQDPLGEAHFLMGDQVIPGLQWEPGSVGQGGFSFAVRDDAGAWTFIKGTLVANRKPPRAPGSRGCGCNCTFASTAGSGFGLLLIGLAFLLFRRRLHKA